MALGLELASLGVNTISDAVGSIGANKRLKKQLAWQQEENRRQAEENYQYGEKAADNAYQRSLGLLEANKEANSLVSQVADAKEAGLSPSIFSNIAGSTGAAAGGGAQGTGSKGISPVDRAALEGIKNEKRSIGIEAARQRAEEIIQIAEAEKIRAETKNIEKDTEGKDVEGELIKVQIKDITENIENKRIQREGQRLQNEFDEIRNKGAKELKEYEIESALRQSELLEEQVKEAARNNDIGDEVYEDVVNSIKQEYKNLLIESAAIDAGIKLNNAQIEAIREGIVISKEGNEIDREKLEETIRNNKALEALNAAGQGGSMVESIMSTVKTIAGALILKGISGTGIRRLGR